MVTLVVVMVTVMVKDEGVAGEDDVVGDGCCCAT